MIRLSEHLWIYQGEINVGVLCDDERALLIDFGEGGVAAACEKQGLPIERVLLTHHHRDQAVGLMKFDEGVTVIAPASERHLFDAVDCYWNDPTYRWRTFEEINLPASAPVGRYVLPVAIKYAGKSLGQFAEAIIR